MMSCPTEVYGKFVLDLNKDKLSPIVLEQLRIKILIALSAWICWCIEYFDFLWSSPDPSRHWVGCQLFRFLQTRTCQVALLPRVVIGRHSASRTEQRQRSLGGAAVHLPATAGNRLGKYSFCKVTANPQIPSTLSAVSSWHWYSNVLLL